MVCRLGYEIGVEITHLHYYDIIYVKIHTCCLERRRKFFVGPGFPESPSGKEGRVPLAF
jgi:hypothetical protein